jgi:hypothetical protein
MYSDHSVGPALARSNEIPCTVTSIQTRLVKTMNETVCKTTTLLPVGTIEILETLEEACYKGRENLFQLVSTLFCEVKRGFVDR